MLSSFKKFCFILILILLLSCEGLSDLLSTNHFSSLDKGGAVLINSDDLQGWTQDDRNEKLDYYSSIALSKEDSEYLYEVLRNDPAAKAELIANYIAFLNTPPDLNNPAEVDLYQKIAAAYAKIEVYTTAATIMDGVDDLVIDYASGASSGGFNQDKVLDEVFRIPATFSSPEEKEQKRQEVIVELTALTNAGFAYEKLGNTITDVDRPSSNYISDEDAVLVLVTAMTGTIIQNTVDNTSLTKEQAIEELVNGIVNRDFIGSQVIFPVSPGNTASNPMELYLGPGGSLTFTSTGFELPPASSLGGN